MVQTPRGKLYRRTRQHIKSHPKSVTRSFGETHKIQKKEEVIEVEQKVQEYETSFKVPLIPSKKITSTQSPEIVQPEPQLAVSIETSSTSASADPKPQLLTTVSNASSEECNISPKYDNLIENVSNNNPEVSDLTLTSKQLTPTRMQKRRGRGLLKNRDRSPSKRKIKVPIRFSD